MTAAYILKPTRNILLITTIALLIFFGGMLMLHTVPLAVKDKVASGLLADFVITFPVLYYFIIIRPLKVSVKKLVFVVSICCGIAYLVLPAHQREYILQVRKLTVLAELLFIIYAASKLRKLQQLYKAYQKLFADPVYNLRTAMAKVMGQSFAIKIIAAELAVLRYGLLFWKKETSALKNSTAFTTHKDFGYIAIWCILLLAVLVEITAFHMLLMRWSPVTATVITALSVYGIIFFIADLSAIIKRKVLISEDQIVLRTGLRWRVITSTDNISSIKKITNDYNSTDIYFKGGISKRSGNLLITFKEPVMVDKLYGESKPFSILLMNIDSFDAFAALIKVY